ncbi:MAG: hypothetical protein ACP6IT_01410 [Candidatus Thorarchaeota archaeon]
MHLTSRGTIVVVEQTTGRLTQEQLRVLRRLEFVKQALEDLRRRGISQDVPICPHCKSFRLIQITSGIDLGALGSLQPAYYCLDCGWYGRTLIIMTNRPESTSVLEDMRDAFADDEEMFDRGEGMFPPDTPW